MKTIVKFFAVLMVFVGSFAFGQIMNNNAQELLDNVNGSETGKPRLLACVTYSCCGWGPFGIEVWSEKTCVTLNSNKLNRNSKIVVMNLKNSKGEKYDKSELTIDNDVIIPSTTYQEKDGQMDVDIIKAGKHQVIDGQLAFEPYSQRIRVTCLTSSHNGHVFGHQYSYSYSVCVVHLWYNKGTNNNGYLTIDISNSKDLIKLASENNNTLRFDEDQVIDNNFIVKAGEYKVNDDLKIYVQNFYIK